MRGPWLMEVRARGPPWSWRKGKWVTVQRAPWQSVSKMPHKPEPWGQSHSLLFIQNKGRESVMKSSKVNQRCFQKRSLRFRQSRWKMSTCPISVLGQMLLLEGLTLYLPGKPECGPWILGLKSLDLFSSWIFTVFLSSYFLSHEDCIVVSVRIMKLITISYI